MRLRELGAYFIGDYADNRWKKSDKLDGAQGVTFECPCEKCIAGRVNESGATTVTIYFANPVNAQPFIGERGWQMSGTSLDDLTLSPSILLRGTCDWHGWVTNGDAK